MNSRETIKKIFRYVKKYGILVLFSFVLATISALLSLYIPILIGNVIDNIVGEHQVDFQKIYKISLGIVILIGITAFSQWIMNICNNKITYHVVRDIREDAFSHLQKLPLSYLDPKPQGEIVSKLIADVEQLSEGLLLGFTQLFTGVVTILGTLVFMVSLNLKITLVVVCITPLSLFVAGFIARNTYQLFRVQSETKGEQTSLIDEMIGNQ